MDIEKRTLLGVSATIVKASIAATAVGVAGCATGPARFGVTYDSFPQGATLVCDGAVMGYTPATLYYKVSELQGYLLLSASNCTANWASGAKRAYEDFRWEKFGNGVTVTSARPDVPGLQQDMDFALSAQHLQAQQQALQLQQQRQRQAQQQDLQQLQLQHQALQPMAAPSSATKNCKKVGDLSGQIYQFQYACPYGYLQSYP